MCNPYSTNKSKHRKIHWRTVSKAASFYNNFCSFSIGLFGTSLWKSVVTFIPAISSCKWVLRKRRADCVLCIDYLITFFSVKFLQRSNMDSNESPTNNDMRLWGNAHLVFSIETQSATPTDCQKIGGVEINVVTFFLLLYFIPDRKLPFKNSA